jgi:hypothetical protein
MKEGSMDKKSRTEKFNTLVSEKLKTDSGPFEFEGFNCDQDECNGWNGLDDRCECGNRRVSWVFSDDETFVYAEAH